MRMQPHFEAFALHKNNYHSNFFVFAISKLFFQNVDFFLNYFLKF